jgi:hypothetical protein
MCSDRMPPRLTSKNLSPLLLLLYDKRGGTATNDAAFIRMYTRGQYTGATGARGCSWPEQKVAVSPCNLVTDSYVEKLLSLLDGICTTHVIPFGPILFICIALYLSISCRFRFCMMSNDSKSRHCIVALLAFERRERLFFSSPTLNR